MKKTLTAMTLLAGAVAGYSQGIVVMVDYGSTYTYHVYNVQTSAPTGNVTAQGAAYGYNWVGDIAADKPTVGGNTAVYNTGSALSGTGFDAQLLAAPTSGDTLSQLTPMGSVFNFSAGGLLNASGKTVSITGSQPGTGSEGGTGGTIALAAWVATGSDGAATTLAEAQADGYAWGISDVVSISALGGSSVPPTTNPTIGIESFSLGSVPEPSTIALGVIGASTLLFRRKK